MKRWLIFPLFTVLVFSLVACAPWKKSEEHVIAELEKLSAKVDENQARLERELDELSKRLDEVSMKVDAQSKELDDLSTDVSEVSQALGSVASEVELLEKMPDLESRLQEIEKNVKGIFETQKVFDERIRKIEAKLTAMGSITATMRNDLKAGFGHIDLLIEETRSDTERALGDLKAELSNVGKTGRTLMDSLERMDSSVRSILTRVATLDSRVSDERGMLDDLFTLALDVDKRLTTLPILSSDVRDVLSNQEEMKRTIDTVTRVVDLDALKNSVDEIKFLLKIAEHRGITREATEMVEHVVKPGETLQLIARAYGVSVNEILRANPSVKDPSKIYAYQKLKIPVTVGEMLSSSKLLQRHIKTKLDWEVLQKAVVHTFGEIEVGYANVGVDLKLNSGEVITAPVGGRVEFAGVLNSTYGRTVRLSVGEGNYIVFGRLGEIFVKSGEMVKAGDAIGRTGDSEVNLHLEIWRDGVPFDPLTFFFEHLGELHVTMYTEWDDGKPPVHPTFKRTATGGFVRAYRTVAADFDFLPPGSLVYIPFFRNWPNRGFFVVEDTGGAVIGKELDVFVHDPELAKRFSRYLDVYLVKRGEGRTK